jgi:Flp pilus assembly protein TadD
VALMAEGRLADAKAAFERALALDPGSVSARRNLAVLRARSGGRGSRAR